MKKNNNLLKVKLHKKKVSKNEFEVLFNLLKKENNNSILSKLSKKIVKEYFNIAIESDHLYLYSCQMNGKIIGYALLAKNSSYLISEFKKIKIRILTNLLINFKFISIINIIIAIIKFDLILLNKKKLNILFKSFNLNLLAISKDYQSKGIGKTFFNKLLKEIYYKHYKFNLIVCEAPNSRAVKFYTTKAKFTLIGKKIRLFKNLYLLVKKYNNK